MASKFRFFAIAALILPCICGGCRSIAKAHHSRLDKISRTRGEIAEISEKLRDIEQVMLYVGRIKTGDVANAALDVAIAIHGGPDEAEKKYAQVVTLEEIEVMRTQVVKLARRRANLEALSCKETKRAIDEAYSIHAMESRYEFLERLVSNCVIATCIAIAVLLLRRVF
ncbi:MAG: hypothetical protein LBI61_01310 [Puniceicoccales bacterium]|jgi:hypothetical protein|nr:hypothetical protein [Puniceicoccales bacterium]